MKLTIGLMQTEVATYNGINRRAYIQIWDMKPNGIGDIIADKGFRNLTPAQYRRMQAIQNKLEAGGVND